MRNAAILYGCFVALVFAPFLLRGEVFVPGDSLSVSYPWKGQVEERLHNVELSSAAINDYPRDHFFNQSLKAGVFPLWNRHLFSGHPTIGGGQSGYLYPPRVLLHRFCSTGVAKTLLQLGHLLVMGMAMFWFFRTRGLGMEASALGGLVWMGNSFAASWLEFEGVVTAGAILPLLLACFEYTPSRSARWWLAIAPLSALCVLGGDSQASSLTLLLFAVYLLLRSMSLRTFKPILWGAGAVALTLLLSAPEWLSLLQLWSESPVSPGTVAKHSTGLGSALLFLLNPDLLGNPTTGLLFQVQHSFPDFAVFVGLVPLILSATARGREANLLRIAATASMLLACYLPPVSRTVFFSPGKCFLLICFCLSYLTAIGCQQLLEAETNRVWCRRWAGLAALLWLGLWVGIIYLSRRPDALFDWWQANASMFKRPEVGSSEQAVVAAFNRTYLRNPQILATAVAAIILFLRPRNMKLLTGITLVELVLFASGFLTTTPPEQLYPETPEIQELTAADGRVVALDCARGNSLTAFGLSLVNGYQTLVSDRYRKALAQAEPAAVLPSRTLSFRRLDRPILDALNVSYALLPPDREPGADGWSLLFEGPGGRVYRNEEAQPRFFLVGRAVPLHNLTPIQIFDPSLEAFVEIQPPANLQTGPGRVTRDKETANSLELLVETETHQLLVVSDAYHPDWKVWVDEERGEIVVANLASRGVYLSPGVHRVRFEFQPTSVIWGGRLALLGILILLVGLIASFLPAGTSPS